MYKNTNIFLYFAVFFSNTRNRQFKPEAIPTKNEPLPQKRPKTVPIQPYLGNPTKKQTKKDKKATKKATKKSDKKSDKKTAKIRPEN